jgi:hypothetical protein
VSSQYPVRPYSRLRFATRQLDRTEGRQQSLENLRRVSRIVTDYDRIDLSSLRDSLVSPMPLHTDMSKLPDMQACALNHHVVKAPNSLSQAITDSNRLAAIRRLHMQSFSYTHTEPGNRFPVAKRKQSGDPDGLVAYKPHV